MSGHLDRHRPSHRRGCCAATQQDCCSAPSSSRPAKSLGCVQECLPLIGYDALMTVRSRWVRPVPCGRAAQGLITSGCPSSRRLAQACVEVHVMPAVFMPGVPTHSPFKAESGRGRNPAGGLVVDGVN